MDRVQIRSCAILWHQGRLLVQAPRANPTRWALPGGRLEQGETLEAGLRREFFEEMNLQVHPQRIVFVHENFFNDEGVLTQEYGFYWWCKTPHESEQLSERTAQPVEAHLCFRWVAAHELPALALFPVFLRTNLCENPQAVRFFSTRDGPIEPPGREP